MRRCWSSFDQRPEPFPDPTPPIARRRRTPLETRTKALSLRQTWLTKTYDLPIVLAIAYASWIHLARQLLQANTWWSKTSAVLPPFSPRTRNHGFLMKNPDTATILGARTGRLRRETVDSLHEHIKYLFNCSLLRKWYRWDAVEFSRWPFGWR